jgi:hypothetical protein
MFLRKKAKKGRTKQRRKHVTNGGLVPSNKVPSGGSALGDAKKPDSPRNLNVKDTEIAEWLVPPYKNYKVRLAKLEGKDKTLRLGETISGYAESLPKKGQEFRIFSGNGLLAMRTSEVVGIGSGYIKTRNSIYKVELVSEEDFQPWPKKND